MAFSSDDVPRESRNPLLATLHARPRFVVRDDCAHGTGLVASEDVGANEVVAVYPIDFVVGTGFTFYYAWTAYDSCMPDTYTMEIDSAYFGTVVRCRPSSGPGVHGPFAKAHLINDVKQGPGIPTRREYERDASVHANVAFVDCTDLVVAETTRPVAKGTEFRASYGYTYWAPSIAGIAERAVASGIREAVTQALRTSLHGEIPYKGP